MSLVVSTKEASAIDSQYASSFFDFPVELRHAVYGHLFNFTGLHIHHSVGDDGVNHFRLTPCTSPNILDGNSGGVEYGSDLFFAPSHVYKRRYLSSWGPHWMCEELAFRWEGYSQELDGLLSASSRDFSSASRVCKRMQVILSCQFLSLYY